MEQLDKYQFNSSQTQLSRKSITFRPISKGNYKRPNQIPRVTLQMMQNSMRSSLVKSYIKEGETKRQILKEVRFKQLTSKNTTNNIISQGQNQVLDICKQSNYSKNKNVLALELKSIIKKQNIKQVLKLLNSPIPIKSFITSQIKCLMIHSPNYNYPLIGRRHAFRIKQKLQVLDKQNLSVLDFKYCHLNSFLRSLKQQNYSSQQTICFYQEFESQSVNPLSIRLMSLYLSSYLYQVNGMYQKAIQKLKYMLDQLLKNQIEELVFIYLILMVRIKSNLLQWKQATFYLMKILAYSWRYQQQDLQIWCYFQLSRCYFFLNQSEYSEFYKNRSQMSIAQSKGSMYRQIIVKQFMNQLLNMRKFHKSFQLSNRIDIYELSKIDKSYSKVKSNETLKIQTQIKRVQQHCKISHVKNLLGRMSSLKKLQQSNSINLEQRYSFRQKSFKKVAGNPLLKSHESGLKNLNIYFRNSSSKKQKVNQYYTMENVQKSIQILRQMTKSLILQMKHYIPILQSPN